MKVCCLLLLFTLLVPLNALAGPNAGGTLIIHNTGLVYGAGGDTVQWCSQGTTLTSCGLANSEVDDSSNAYTVWKVYAAFDSTSSPRLKAFDFGITYDAYDPGTGFGSLVLMYHGPCIGDEDNGAHEFPGAGWPASGANSVLVFENTQTTPLVESYWFAGYAYYGRSGVFELTQGQFGNFADDAVPANLDAIADYGKLGFNTAGYVACPGGWFVFNGGMDGPIHGGGEEDGGGSEGGDSPPPPPPAPVDSTYQVGSATETFTVATGNTVILDQWGERHVYHGGDQIHLSVEDGRGGINGYSLWPQIPPTVVHPIDYIRDQYGSVPSVTEYVASHTGDSTTVWNDGLRVACHIILLPHVSLRSVSG